VTEKEEGARVDTRGEPVTRVPQPAVPVSALRGLLNLRELHLLRQGLAALCDAAEGKA
jgi:hypothetical protein